MPEPIPAIVLSRIRRAAYDAQRRHTLLDPRTVLAIINGGKA